MEFERYRVEPDTVKSKNFYPVVMISLVAHGILGWLLFHYSIAPKISKPEQNIQAIQAQLVFIKPEKQKEEIESEDLQTANPPKPKDTQEPAASNEPDELAKQPRKAEQESKRNALPAIGLPTLPDENDLNLSEVNEDEKTQTSPPILSSREMARKHLQSSQRQANQQFLEQQASEYRRQQTSPDLNLPEFDAFTNEDEKYRKKLTTRVDCSTGINKTLAVISGITGGQLTCSKQADLTPYIDKHVKKPIAQPQQ